MDIPQAVETIIHFISVLGFPIFVAIWLMYRDWKVITGLLKTLTELNHALDRLTIMLDALIAAFLQDPDTEALYRILDQPDQDPSGHDHQD